jgi:hypothetical protein
MGAGATAIALRLIKSIAIEWTETFTAGIWVLGVLLYGLFSTGGTAGEGNVITDVSKKPKMYLIIMNPARK